MVLNVTWSGGYPECSNDDESNFITFVSKSNNTCVAKICSSSSVPSSVTRCLDTQL